MDTAREIATLKDEIGYISRYMGKINPKLSIFKELDTKKNKLKKRLREIEGTLPGNTPKSHGVSSEYKKMTSRI